MSYDFHLFRPTPGLDLLEAAQASFLDESEEPNPGPPVPEKEQQKRQNATLLQLANSALTICPFDYGQIARSLGCSEAEARVRYRHLELNGPEDGNGVQITLADDTASITVPYWHNGERAEPVLGEAWTYMRVLERRAGFRTYDPQLERLLDLDRDLPDVVQCYRSVADRLPEIAAQKLAERPLPGKRPWWKLW